MSERAWFLDDEPSTRFPVYCRGNVGEIVPWVATPLAATVAIPAFELAFNEMFGAVGAFSAEEMAEPAFTGGVFGGYLYFNLSFARTLVARMPGMSPDDVDQQMFGIGGDAPPYRVGPGDKNLLTKARSTVGMVRLMAGRRKPDLDADRAETLAWVNAMPVDPTDDEIAALTAGYTERLGHHLRSLLDAGFGGAIPLSMLERLTKRAEQQEPGTLLRAMSGLGTIETARPAIDMWHLGRLVASRPALSAAFDAGVGGLDARLRASDEPDAVDFVARFDAFLAAHGHRGPNEVELASDTWSTAPDSALAVIDRLRFTPEAADPEQAARRLERERIEAADRLREHTPVPLRPLVKRMLAAAARGASRREQAKGTLVLGTSGLRRVLFQRADALVGRGDLPDRKQFFMATVDELPALLSDPGALAGELAKRRERYEELNSRVPPFAFEGRMPDPSTWPRRTDAPKGAKPSSFTGIGVSSGVARGPARVITDPGDPRGFEPGDVLVAPLTDPAWTPLFLAAVAVVVDVGALQSHAAIVARELGIPAVVSVEGASATIADGDVLEVDGDRGTVKIV